MVISRPVRIWLWLGVVMIFFQIVLGGITRLTGSGLSITQWDIVTGTIPPLNHEQWVLEFDKYKETPQYHKINQGMSLKDFRFIYFWEYFHRLWARSIGFVFLIPFIVFLWQRSIDRKLLRQLSIAVLFGVFAATFGWIMVASGLRDRPWVNAYKLTVHLNIALSLYAWLVWVALGEQKEVLRDHKQKSYLVILTVAVVVQLILGGLMSGMKAGLYYPTWPDMHGEFFPKALTDRSLWTLSSVLHYERGLVPGLVQFSHRMLAYLIALGCVVLYAVLRKSNSHGVRIAVQLLLAVVILQVCLGILTVVNCVGSVPLLLGVSHQIGAILVLTVLVFLHRKIAH